MSWRHIRYWTSHVNESTVAAGTRWPMGTNLPRFCSVVDVHEERKCKDVELAMLITTETTKTRTRLLILTGQTLLWTSMSARQFLPFSDSN